MKLAILGSRTFNNYNLLKTTIENNYSDIRYIISGGAKGADMLGENYAIHNNIKIIKIVPNWILYGKKAGFMRNHLIIDEADSVLAFWDGISKGTKHSIELTKKQNKPLQIINF